MTVGLAGRRQPGETAAPPVTPPSEAGAGEPRGHAVVLGLLPAILVAMLAWGLASPSASRVVQLGPDIVEYIDIARRLAAGEGYVLGIKAYHIGGPEVLQDGLIHRPPLYTLLVGGLFSLGFDLPAVQVVNAAIGALSAALVCSIGMALFGRLVGIAAGVLAAISPVALEQQIPILTDGLATLLTLLAVRLLLTSATRSLAWPALLAGLVFGIGYLTRPPIVVIGLATACVLPFVVADRGRRWRPLAALVAGLLLVLVPATFYSLLVHGRLSYSGKGYLYGVVSDADVMENGYETQPLTPIQFITSRPGFVLGAIRDVFTLYLRSLFTEREWLLPLAVGWPGAVVALVRGWYPRVAWIALAAAGANLVFYGLNWSLWQDRYMLTTLFLLLPFAVDGTLRAVRWLTGWLPAGLAAPSVAGHLPAGVAVVLVAVVGVYWLPRFVSQYRGEYRYGERVAGTRLDDGLRWTGPPRWVNDGSLDEAIDWIRERTAQNDVLAHGQPWPYTFFTGRPSVLLPYRLSDARLRAFLIEYRVSYLLFDPRDPQRRAYLDQLRGLGEEGVRSVRVGSLMVFDTRPLWQDR